MSASPSIVPNPKLTPSNSQHYHSHLTPKTVRPRATQAHKPRRDAPGDLVLYAARPAHHDDGSNHPCIPTKRHSHSRRGKPLGPTLSSADDSIPIARPTYLMTRHLSDPLSSVRIPKLYIPLIIPYRQETTIPGPSDTTNFGQLLPTLDISQLSTNFRAKKDSPLGPHTRYIPRIRIPHIRELPQPDRYLITGTPRDQIEVIIVLESRSIKYPIRQRWDPAFCRSDTWSC
jgi:hypothetical protein